MATKKQHNDRLTVAEVVVTPSGEDWGTMTASQRMGTSVFFHALIGVMRENKLSDDKIDSILQGACEYVYDGRGDGPVEHTSADVADVCVLTKDKMFN